MRQKIQILLFLISAVVLQSILAPRMALFGVKPDLLLMIVVLWAISSGAEEGGLIGLVIGLFEDIVTSGIYINTLVKPILGFISGVVRGNLAVASSFSSACLVFMLTPAGYLIKLLCFLFFFGRQLPSFYSTFSVIFVASAYNFVLTLLLFPVIFPLIERLGSHERGDMKEYKLYRI